MTIRKTLAFILTLVMAITVLAGCGGTENDGKVSITIGNAPVEGQANYELFMQGIEDFRADHPEWEVNTSSYTYDTKNFMAKAAANQLPTVWSTFFTEVGLISNAGYCKDISKSLEKTGLLEALNPVLLSIVQGETGEIWGLPTDGYAQGLHINKKLFIEAGLVNEDGSIMIPQTYEELAEYAGIIREKTGQAGFILPTTNNYGGWHFMNIAWSFGTTFMEQNDDGSWKATFDSPEFKAALNWLYDLKWNKNGIQDNALLSNTDFSKYFGIYQGAMMFTPPVANNLISQYGMEKDDIMCVSVPGGPAGRFAQTGGNVVMFRSDATEAEVEAALAYYIEQKDFALEVTDESLALNEKSFQNVIERGQMLLASDPLPKFTNRKNENRLTELKQKYSNVDEEDYADYLAMEKITLRPEEPVCCQQLYAIIDGILQEILSNKNCDIDALVAAAAKDFQTNHLNNL